MNRAERYGRLFLSSLLAASFGHSTASAGPVPAPAGLPPKPLQIVTLAFDGSEEAMRWQQTTKFAQDVPVKFTYFASGVMFLGRNRPLGSDGTKDPGIRNYQGPSPHGPGHSDIGFSAYESGNGDGPDNEPLITERIKWANTAIDEGHEIGSHLNGHFESNTWHAADWNMEFINFWNLLFVPHYPGNSSLHAPALNRPFLTGMKYTMPANKLVAGGGAYDPNNEATKNAVVGFRAPLLAWTPDMFPVLENAGFLYDTSKVSQPNYWPEKIGNHWNFPLASINLAGCTGGPQGHTVFDVSGPEWADGKGSKDAYPDTNKPYLTNNPGKAGAVPLTYEEQCDTLTMDYNLLVAQADSAHRNAPIMITDARKQKLFENQVVDTYRAYFKSNYNGNRAPVEIGHHFALWNGGIYWGAMQRLAKEVCVLSDVRCIKYKDLMAYMEHLTPSELANYKAGRFSDKMEADLAMYNKDGKGKARAISSIADLNEALAQAKAKADAAIAKGKKLAAAERARLEQGVADAQANIRAAILQLPQGDERIDILHPDNVNLSALESKYPWIKKGVNTFNAAALAAKYSWLTEVSAEEKAHPLLTAQIQEDAAYMKNLADNVFHHSRAMECEGGSQECVDSINTRVAKDLANLEKGIKGFFLPGDDPAEKQ